MSSRFGVSRAVVLVGIAALSTSVAYAHATWHVDDDAAPGGDGTTWSTAFRYLQDALAVATAGDEIRAGGGTYKPDRGEAGNVTPGDRTAAFRLISGVSLYGGFAGLADPNNPDARNIVTYESILSGDLSGDDDPNAPPDPNDPVRLDNSYHIIIASDADETAGLDGFTITAGNANGEASWQKRGGGVYDHNGSATLVNCTIKRNSAAHYGGGVYNRGSGRLTLIDCTLEENRGGEGGALCNENSSPTLIGCTLTGNSGGHYGGGVYNIQGGPTLVGCTFGGNRADLGGGICTREYTNPVLTGCIFRGNSADDGGGIYNYRHARPTLINCIFSENMAANYGGAISHHLAASHPPPTSRPPGEHPAGLGTGSCNSPEISVPALTNCTFNSNAASQGGAFANGWSDPLLVNCILWRDTPDEIFDDPDSGIPATTTATYSDIQGGWPGEGNLDADPGFVDPAAGDYRLRDSSPCINAGSNYAPNLPDADIAGDTRIQFCRVDLGAYESPYPSVDVRDCNSNGVDDDCDIYDGTSDDYDQNHVPDECDPDCNGNGVPDACDIDCARGDCTHHPLGCGGSDDCQPNGVPDECDLVAGTSSDFDHNDVPDECDCLGDLNGDRHVDAVDLTHLLLNYGTTSGAEYADGDLDRDGDVDLADLALMLAVYGMACI